LAVPRAVPCFVSVFLTMRGCAVRVAALPDGVGPVCDSVISTLPLGLA
jgi:hypothetical protein